MKQVMSVIALQLRPALVFLAVFSVGLGVLYPATVEAIVKHGFNLQIEDGTVRTPSGRILATSFSGPAEQRPQYFWGKIYGPETIGCDTMGSASQTPCQQAIARRLAALRSADSTDTIPSDLLTVASTNLQPEISVAAAQYQAPRVAAARQITQTQVEALIAASTHNSIYSTTKALYVNVLELNLRMDGKLV